MRSWKRSTSSTGNIWSRWLSVEVHLHEALSLNVQYLLKGELGCSHLESFCYVSVELETNTNNNNNRKTRYNCTKVYSGGPKSLSGLLGSSKEGGLQAVP